MSDTIKIPASLIRGYITIMPAFKVGVPIRAEWNPDSEIIGIKDYWGSDAIPDSEPARNFDERLTRCYELAGYAYMFGDEFPRHMGYLVHGSIHGKDAPERIGHAWLTITTPAGTMLVWEPITGLLHLKDEWYAYASARDEVKYNQRAAAAKFLESHHWGRWHESKFP